MALLDLINDYKKHYPQSWTISTTILQFGEGIKYKYLPPNVNKDVYYSIYIHEIIFWAKHLHYNYYTILELIYTMVLTPSPSAWRENVINAMQSKTQDNFFVKYVKETLKNKSSVAAGSGIRKQVSCGASITYHQLYSSLKNMHALITKTNLNPNEKIGTIIHWWSAPVTNGGMHLVGSLWAQEILNILTKLDIIKDKRFLSHGIIAPSTNTAKKLKRMGIKTKADRDKLLKFVTQHIQYDGRQATTAIAESSVCEGFRHADLKISNCGNPYFSWPYVDTVHDKQHLYFSFNNVLYVLQKSGSVFVLTMEPWKTHWPFCGLQWWKDNEIQGKHKKCILAFSDGMKVKLRKFCSTSHFKPTPYSPLMRKT